MLDARESSLLKDLGGLVRFLLKATECWKVSLDCSASLGFAD